ncbi:SAP domain-containing protein [Geobacter hydrogenophilus]|jgi:hypothetical protein|uniref:SAP domain-containing protein n=1 Tax=Geobacter hydrogenophilus TaxID=40983 RepID=A0A9W6G250_9BACT|nr:SAP domain-containing protein [Geobacter hydrogenophilus]MBT0895271.1 SAP domain-containing protein [Geobacter hydrogenophilus]GLI39500.1 SAP domain-containing protein [Geobacter hydrogenophilus]
MNLTDIKKIAVQHGLSTTKLKKVEIVRAIQAEEGNTPCFDTGLASECGQTNCLWRDDCK